MVTAVRVTRTVTRAATFSCVFAADVLVSSARACGRCGRRGCGGGLGMQLARFGAVYVGGRTINGDVTHVARYAAVVVFSCVPRGKVKRDGFYKEMQF